MPEDRKKNPAPQPAKPEDDDQPDMMPPEDTVDSSSEALGASLILPAGHGVGAAKMVKRTLRLKAKKPNPRRFIRVHPEMSASVAIFLDPNDEDEFEKAPYVVLGHVAEELSGSDIVPNVVYLYAYRTGSLGLWPCPLTGSGGRRANAWGTTRLEVAEKAKTSWVRCHASDDGEGYAYTEPVDLFPDPAWDRWLRGRSMLQLLGIAFRDRVIDTLDHPVLREFDGRLG
jgi:hypothetical protein